MKISIQASAIRAATICAAKKDIRYYLVGVHIKVAHTGFASVIGTNGHIMFAGRATIENLEGQQSAAWTMTIPLETCKKISKKADIVILESLPDGNYLIDGIRFAPIDGRFPDHTRVITRLDQVTGNDTPSQFNYEYLIQGNDALNAYYGGKNKVYALVQRGNDAGLMHNGENTAVVVIMPMRVKDIGNYQGFNDTFPDPLTTVQLAA
jgi:DNA polymerase III sliding clamp (beta) subunit (PCNA family)